MHGDKLYSVGITVWFDYAGGDRYGWWAKVEFGDFSRCARGSVTGVIQTRYGDDLRFSIDTIKADAQRLGIEFVILDGEPPFLLYLDDGETIDYPPPEGWRKTLTDEARRIGFRCIYKSVPE